ncbi:hypothetical protein [Psychrobacter sp. WY6]|uniref:hypothetical protein n=1 Tax=Psychrobacter sp. WY6 TaxID=2708350 RepID=UPI002022D121|nr:hypothetical protein [Psychrobacter sp. WY6]
MKFFKLSALALASTLALAGCGDDNNNSSSGNGTNTPDVPVKPPVDNSLSEIEQAKEMIRTAKLFVSDNKAVTDAYEDVSDILTEKQDTRLGYTEPPRLYRRVIYLSQAAMPDRIKLS